MLLVAFFLGAGATIIVPVGVCIDKLDLTCIKYSDLKTSVSILYKKKNLIRPIKKSCKLHKKPGKFCLPIANLLLGSCLYTKLLAYGHCC